MKHHKLVRDRIPEMIKKEGASSIVHHADDEEYWEKLKDKLEEEVNEFLEKENLEELADVLEVIEAIRAFKGMRSNDLKSLRAKKAKEKGVFKKRIILEETA